MAGFTDRAQHLLEIGGDIDTNDLGARNHDIANPRFGQVEDSMQHAPLFRRDHA